MSGGTGDDVIISSLDGAGNDYSGDAGVDTINLIPNDNGIFVDLDAGIARDRATLATSSVFTIENAVGTAMPDYLYGDELANRLSGYSGDDLLRGRGGNDDLAGDNGRDVSSAEPRTTRSPAGWMLIFSTARQASTHSWAMPATISWLVAPVRIR